MRLQLLGIGLGMVAGVADCALFAFSGMTVTVASALSAITFWAAVGWAISIAPSRLPHVIKGAVVSLGMAVPWVLEFAGNQGAVELVVPMAVLAVVFGAGIALPLRFLETRGIASPRISTR